MIAIDPTPASALVAQLLWQSPALLPAAVAALALALAAVLWLYPPQVAGLPRGWRWAPPLLRSLALAAVAVSLVQPAVLRPASASRRSAVAVLIDRSHSMSVSDAGRSPAELVALADGLGALPAGLRPRAAPELRAALDGVRSALDAVDRARSEADYARLAGRGEPAAQARLREAGEQFAAAVAALELPSGPAAAVPELTDRLAQLKRAPATPDEAAVRAVRDHLSAANRALAEVQARADAALFEGDASVRETCIRLGTESRLALVERGLTSPGPAALASLSSGSPIYGFSFADDVQPLSMRGQDAAVHVDAAGPRTHLASALSDVARRLRGRPVAALVLLSDGRQARADETETPDASALGVPVFAVAAAPAGERRDVAVASLEVPSAARVDETLDVRVGLRAAGFAGQAVTVHLEVEGERHEQQATVGEDATALADFTVRISRAGAVPVTAGVVPLAGEISGENNRAQRWVRVGAGPMRLMVLSAGSAGKQLASLRAALSRAPWVALHEVAEDELDALPPGAMLEQDVVILCDVAPDALWAEQWDALDRLVRERGGSVVLCAGAKLPSAYAAHPRGAQWLPVVPGHPLSWRTWPGGAANFRVVPARDGEARRDEAGASSHDPLWRQLPPVSRLVPLAPLRPDVRPLLVERESGAAVVTQERAGAGTVTFIGTDDTWRWEGGGGASGASAHPFWTRLLRRVARQPYAASAGGLSLDASPVAPEPGEPITLRARVLAADGRPTGAETQQVRVLRDDDEEEVRTVTLRSTGGGDGRYEGSIHDGLPAGQYVLQLDAADDPSFELAPEPLTLALRVAPNLEPEMADLSGDHELLRRLAQSSGGRLLTLDQMESLPRLLADARDKQGQWAEYRLWDSPYLYAFVLACLSAEWALRKKLGLA